MKFKKKLLINILLLLITILIFLIIFEIFFPKEFTVSSYTILHDGPGVFLKNGIPLYHGKLLNLIGTLPEEESVVRVFTIGDSFTYGYGVNRNETYSYYLQLLLNNNSMYKNFEVINIGICGYNLFQIYEVFKEVLKYQPDIIIYGIMDNDLDFINTVKNKGGHYIIVSYRDEIPYVISFPFNKFFLKNSKFWRSINKVLIKVPAFRENIKYYKSNLEDSKKVLKDMYLMSYENNISFYIFLIPNMGGGSSICDYSKVYDEIPLFKEDFVYYNFPADLRHYTNNNCSKISIENSEDPSLNGHPTSEGHQLFAQLLYQFLKEKLDLKMLSIT